MKKNKFSSKLALNKNIISNLEDKNIVGGGLTWQATCLDDCISLNAKKHENACRYPIYTDDCGPSQGCEPPTRQNCPTLYVTC